MAETTSRTKKTATAVKPSTKPAAKTAATKTAPAKASAAAATKKPAATKAAGTKAAPVKTAAKKPAPAPKTAAAKKPATKKTVVTGILEIDTPKIMVVSDEQRYRMIAEAAYYRAEANSFRSDSVRDWIEAEKDIAALLSGASR